MKTCKITCEGYAKRKVRVKANLQVNINKYRTLVIYFKIPAELVPTNKIES
jgi:hypothetical protein